MSSEPRRRVTARRAWLAALAGGMLAVGSAGSVALGQTPNQVIDAGTDADAAAQALNEGCADMSKCDWQSDSSISANDYGPYRIIGDVLYNCSATGQAQTAIGVSDERGESTSLSESVSLEINGGFLGFEKTSVDFEAFSKQAQSFTTTVEITETVAVPPGYKGYTLARTLTAGVSGSAYITQGIHLIQVKDIDMQFPGFQGSGAGGKRQVQYAGTAEVMSDLEYQSRCIKVGAPTTRPTPPPPPTTPATRAAQAPRRAAGRRARFKITVCRAKRPASRSRRSRCARRSVTGWEHPPRLRRVTATLERAGRVYAAERDRRGGIRLTQRRTITPGRYRLFIREKVKRFVLRRNGRRLHTAEQHMNTIVPVTIRWTRRK